MTTFEKAVKVIAEDYREEAEMHECETCGELFKVCWFETEDLKEDFLSILKETDIEYTDDCEIVDGYTFYSFRKLAMAVRRYKF